ncbi:MAG: type I-E CRISPR-associated protein Cas5/CasD [Planctomycetota bacterium]|nr:MAG: type I-E CRISPR-associated protein Cas5/CasD [Planctomycetota bacterium]
MQVLLLYLDAPLMSFGGTVVDQNGPTEAMPGRSMLTGLIGNALGWQHGDWQPLQDLQARIRHSVRADRMGEMLTDYQTVDLGQDFLRATGWTTRGKREDRKGASGTSTHLRYREHWANAVRTVALTLEPADKAPDLDAITAALLAPARPLFLGRKPCLPAHPLLAPVDPQTGKTPSLVECTDLRSALINAPWTHPPTDQTVIAWVPEDASQPEDHPITVDVCDERDWRNQLPVGRRSWHKVTLPCPQPEEV